MRQPFCRLTWQIVFPFSISGHRHHGQSLRRENAICCRHQRHRRHRVFLTKQGGPSHAFAQRQSRHVSRHRASGQADQRHETLFLPSHSSGNGWHEAATGFVHSSFSQCEAAEDVGAPVRGEQRRHSSAPRLVPSGCVFEGAPRPQLAEAAAARAAAVAVAAAAVVEIATAAPAAPGRSETLALLPRGCRRLAPVPKRHPHWGGYSVRETKRAREALSHDRARATPPVS